MSRPMRMLYVVADGIFSPVIDSQVIVPLRLLGQAAPHVKRALLVLTSGRHRKHAGLARREQEVRAALGDIPLLHRFRWPLGLPLEAYNWAALTGGAIADLGYGGPEPIIIHGRGDHGAAAGALLKRKDHRIRVLLDVRGASGDEVTTKMRGLRARYTRWHADRLVRLAVRGADAVNTVSRAMAEYMIHDEHLNPELPRSVVGCCVDTERFYYDCARRSSQRAALGLDGKFVLCYCGSMAAWQRPDVVARTFAAVARQVPDAHLLVVSREAGVLLEEVRRQGVEAEGRVKVRSAAHDQVAQFLMAADVGLLLREDSLTNRVAAPVKFAEYLRCGLPVVMTPHVGDASGFVAQAGLGVLVPFDGPAEQVVPLIRALRDRVDAEGEALRQRCTQTAQEHFSWAGQMPELLRLYEHLAQL